MPVYRKKKQSITPALNKFICRLGVRILHKVLRLNEIPMSWLIPIVADDRDSVLYFNGSVVVVERTTLEQRNSIASITFEDIHSEHDAAAHVVVKDLSKLIRTGLSYNNYMEMINADYAAESERFDRRNGRGEKIPDIITTVDDLALDIKEVQHMPQRSIVPNKERMQRSNRKPVVHGALPGHRK